MRITPVAQHPTYNEIEYYIGLTNFQLLTVLLILALHITIDLSSPHMLTTLSLKPPCSRMTLLLTKAFCVFVRPLLELSSVVWNQVLKQDITRIESVQRRFTKRLSGLRNFPYTTRLSYLGLDSLQCRRTKADLSMCYKITNNNICTQVVSLFTFSSTKQTRGHSRKLHKSRVSSVRDGHSFSKRIVNVWNSLPERVVMSKSFGTLDSGQIEGNAGERPAFPFRFRGGTPFP